MPTGYTAKLMENGQEFPEFVMGCARAFGALIMMRDDSSDATIPDKFEPSDYHIKKITESREALKALQIMNGSEQLIFGEEKKTDEIKRNEEWLANEISQNERLFAMENQVDSWEPPTVDHQGLKDFMLQQIKISKNDCSYIQKSLKESQEKPFLTYYMEALAKAKRDVEYHAVENVKELERNSTRNEWIQRLRSSINHD